VSQRTQAEISQKVNRITKALRLKPAIGLGTGVSIARITDGLSCTIQEGEWELQTDMPEQAGGTGCAPTPGVLGRAALGSCLAIGYMIWASKLNVPVDNLEVEVQADWDDAGTFGTADVPAGYLEVRYCVRVESSASVDDIIRLLDEGDAHSPYLDVFSRSQSCMRQVELNGQQI